MFELTKEELSRSQFVTLNNGRGSNFELKELKEYIEEVFADYNDINEDTRIQLELINKTLAELQTQKKIQNKPRNPIGFK